MTQISFPLDRAHEALDQFLNDGDREHDGRRMSRTILDTDGRALAVVLDSAHHRELLEAWHAWNDSQEPEADADLPPGYRPYLHSPNASTDRLLPHEPLHDPLARGMFGKAYDDLEQGEKGRLIGVAIACLLRATLDTDTQGAVPVLAWSHTADDPEPRTFWQLAYKTGVDGLFLRAEENGFFGPEWAIVTGAGWRLASGWWSREDADRAAAAVARVLPFIDWMTATSEAFTAPSKKALAQTIRRYRFTGVQEDVAEPEPLTAEEAATV